MITQAVMTVAAGFVHWMVSLFPSWTVPDWFVNFGNEVSTFIAGLGGLGAWIDWAVLIAVATATIGTFAVCLAIKLLRAVASYIPLVGGAG